MTLWGVEGSDFPGGMVEERTDLSCPNTMDSFRLALLIHVPECKSTVADMWGEMTHCLMTDLIKTESQLTQARGGDGKQGLANYLYISTLLQPM